jgi:hypothetical protein
MKILIFACGVHSIGFAIFHLFFWKIFNWKEDLKTASISTRAIIQIANLRLIYVFIGVGLICFMFPEELSQTRLGNTILFGMSLFWLGRFVEQFIFLRYNRLMIHALSGLFAIGTILFALPLMFQ